MTPPFTLKFVLKVTHHPFKQHNFDQYLLIAPQPWELAKKSSISTKRKSTMCFPTSHRWTVYVIPKSPTGGTKRDFAIFSVNFEFCQIKSATKFLCVKTSSGRVVATSFLYLTVHGRIADNVSNSPSTYNLRSKWPTPSKNADFDRFRLIVMQLWELARIAIIANKKSTTRFPSSHRWTLCVTPKSPKKWLETKIFTFGITFHFLVAGHRRHFKSRMWVEHSKSQPTNDKPSLKLAWPSHVTHFKFLFPLRYLWDGLS